MKRTLLAFAATVPLALSVQAADKVKIGFISTLSGPNAAIGTDIRDGFNLAVKLAGGKLGGLPAEVIVADDQLNPDVAKQNADRLVKRDRVDFVTGTVFSNVVLAIAPQVLESKTFFIGPNAGPAQYTGAQCNPFFFVSSWPSEAYSEAAGQYVTGRGFKNVVFLAPNYQGGKDAANGFKRYYKGKLAEEMYTKLGQLDYAAELAQIRAAKPDALYVFLPGGMGVNFIKQFVASGMSKDVQLVVPLWGVGPGHHPRRRRARCSASSASATGPSTSTTRPTRSSSPSSRRSTSACPPGTRRSGYDTGAADRCRDPRGQGPDRGQGRPAQRAQVRGLQERARRFQVRREPVPGAELLPAGGRQGCRRHASPTRRWAPCSPIAAMRTCRTAR